MLCLKRFTNPLITSHFSVHFLHSALPTKQQAFYCDTLSAFSPHLFMKTHSDPQLPPSVAPLIKDTGITTKFRTSTCHHWGSKCMHYVCFLIYASASACGCVCCVCECLCLLLHLHTGILFFFPFLSCVAQIVIGHCCSNQSHDTQHQSCLLLQHVFITYVFVFVKLHA